MLWLITGFTVSIGVAEACLRAQTLSRQRYSEVVEVLHTGLRIRVTVLTIFITHECLIDAHVVTVLRRRAIDIKAHQGVIVVLIPGQVDVALATRSLQIEGLGARGDDLKAEALLIVTCNQSGVVGRYRTRDSDVLVTIRGDGRYSNTGLKREIIQRSNQVSITGRDN